DIISAIDEYLTTVNYPTEESRLRFTLVNEVDAWYISAITDSRFARLREMPDLQAAGAAAGQAGTEAPPADVAQLNSDAPEPIATTTSPDVGRMLSDARFHATLQGFNDSFRAAPRLEDLEDGREPARQPFLKRLAQRLRLRKNRAEVTEAELDRSLQNIREAITRYTVNNDNTPPDESVVRDWRSLRQLVSDHGRKRRQIPDDESAAGFRFVRYTRDAEGFVLQLEFLSPQNGFTHAEITPYRVIRTY
ncbi:MAG: hypothetical protein OXP66_03155, partial [Candidatus Tectomicrobia bacterium]|nr:hypothetical protein [Candidatus Tectomicrobia bacterium]